MKVRRLTVTPELWMGMLTNPRPQCIQVLRDGLPEDARCIRMEPLSRADGTPDRVVFWIESATFRDDDPEDLPQVMLRTITDRSVRTTTYASATSPPSPRPGR